MNKSVVFEIIKWVFVFILLFVSIVGNYLYHDCNFLVRSILVCFMVIMAFGLILSTKIGRLVMVFGIDAYLELRKVIWPTYQDGLYTTLVVMVVTFLVSLVLWGLDSLLVYIISYGLRL